MELMWNDLGNTITAEETLGRKNNQSRNNFFNEECRETIKNKNAARAQLLQRPTRVKEIEYVEKRRTV